MKCFDEAREKNFKAKNFGPVGSTLFTNSRPISNKHGPANNSSTNIFSGLAATIGSADIWRTASHQDSSTQSEDSERIKEAKLIAEEALSRTHPKNEQLEQATLEIQNAYSGNTSLYFPVKKNVAQEELRKEREKLRKWHAFYCSKTCNMIFYLNMIVVIWVQVKIVDHPVQQTKDWTGGETDKCPCYIYTKAKTTNADLLSKFYMVPPGYKSLQENSSATDEQFAACLTEVTGESPLYDISWMHKYGLDTPWLSYDIPPWMGIVTMGCAIVAGFDRYIKYHINGHERFIKTAWNKASVLIIAAMFIQGAINVGSKTVVNAIIIVHPWLIICKSSALKSNINNTVKAFQELKALGMLTGIFLVAFALIATQMERAVCSFENVLEMRKAQTELEETCKLSTFGSGTQCDFLNITQSVNATALQWCDLFQEAHPNFYISVITLFVMLTTENYPDVSYGPVHIAQPVLVLYIFYIFFVLFVIMSIILAVNYDKFKEIKVETYTKKKQREYDSLMTAYLTLTSGGGGSNFMDFKTYIALMACLHEHRGGASHENVKRWNDQFQQLDEDGGGTIDAVEFSKLLEVMKTKLTEGKSSLTDWVWRHKRWGGLEVFKKMVEWKHFGKIADSAIVANSVTLILSNSFDEMQQMVHEGRTETGGYMVLKICEYLDDTFCLVFVVEILIRVLAFGVFFIPSVSNWFDLIVSLAGVPGFSCFGRCQLIPVKVNVLRLMRTPRLLRLLGSSGQVSKLIRTTIGLVPPVSSMMAVLVVMFISLGLLFTCLFRCSYRYMFGEAADILVAANFNTFSSSITIVFQVLTGSNWHEVMHSAQWSLDPDDGVQSVFIALLFSAVFIFLVLCVMNLVVSLVIESYSQDKEDGEEEKEPDMEMTEFNGQDSPKDPERKKEKKDKPRRRLTSLMVTGDLSKPENLEKQKELEYSMMKKAAVNSKLADDGMVKEMYDQIDSHRSSVETAVSAFQLLVGTKSELPEPNSPPNTAILKEEMPLVGGATSSEGSSAGLATPTAGKKGLKQLVKAHKDDIKILGAC